jgi:hypothetical protein
MTQDKNTFTQRQINPKGGEAQRKGRASENSSEDNRRKNHKFPSNENERERGDDMKEYEYEQEGDVRGG